MERRYFFNLLFKDKKMDDTEHVVWDYITTSSMKKSFSLSKNTLKILKDGCYIKPNVEAHITTKKFTISFKYKIDEIFLQKNRFFLKDIYSMQWSNGFIKVLENVNDQSFIKINLNGNEFLEPVYYFAKPIWHHLLISCNNNIIRIFINGGKVKEHITDNISYDFTDIKFGNYIQQEQSHPAGPVIEYNELVLVDDCLYYDNFKVPTHPLHLLFPELIYKEEEKKSPEKLVCAPYIYSSKDSTNDIINNYDIIRHRNFVPDKSRHLSKYKFE